MYYPTGICTNPIKGYTVVDIKNNDLMHLIDFRLKNSDNMAACLRYLEYALKHCVQLQTYHYFVKQHAYFLKFDQIHLGANTFNCNELRGF